MTESTFENSTITGNNVKAGQTAYQKYFDNSTGKWERISGSGAPTIQGLFSRTGSSNEATLLDANCWCDLALAANESVTGSWTDILDYGSMYALIQPTETGSLYFQHSMDGITVDRTFPFSVTSEGAYYTFAPRGKYMRVIYTNDGQPTVLRLQVWGGKYANPNYAQPAGTPMTDISVIQPVKAIIAGRTTAAGKTYVDVKVNPSGALSVEATVVDSSVGVTGSLTSVTNVPNVRITGSTITQPISGSISIINTGSILICDISGSTAIPVALVSDSIQNRLFVTTMPYTYDIAEGNISGHSQYTKLGILTPLGVTSEVDLWTQGGKYVFPTNSGSMLLQSTSINDKTGSVGVQTVRISYLDINFVSKTEILSMNGTTPVPTTNTDIYRVNAIRAATIGSSGSAIGTITLSGSTSATVYRAISIGYTRGRSLIYSVPTGSTLYLTDMHLSSVNNQAGHYTRYILRANYDDQINSKINFFQPYGEILLQDQALAVTFTSPIRVPTTCDLVMSVQGDNSGNQVTGVLRGWLET